MPTKIPLRPITAAEVPLHFMADYCLRCGTMFEDGQLCHIVKGGPSTKYRTIGLGIDDACLYPPDFDHPVMLTLYRRLNENLKTGYWPRYMGNPSPRQGFAKVSMLDNGLAFVGLHRGHVEIWRRKEVQAWGGVQGSYSEDYTLYTPGPGLYHSVLEVRFYDLATPIPPARAMTHDANRYVRGGTRHAGIYTR
jgi:hypothetical protein